MRCSASCADSTPCAALAGASRWSAASWAAALAHPQYVVSQKGRRIPPGRDHASSAARRCMIVNDDGDLRHHAYVDSDKFNFDSGDQEPGSKTSDHLSRSPALSTCCARSIPR